VVINAPLSNFGSEDQTETVSPKSHGFVANINATLKQQTFDLPQRERVTDVHHHRETDNFGRAIKETEGVLHLSRLRNSP
jgi:hypothetical protein